MPSIQLKMFFIAINSILPNDYCYRLRFQAMNADKCFFLFWKIFKQFELFFFLSFLSFWKFHQRKNFKMGKQKIVG